MEQNARPLFQRVAIVGVGLIGGSLGLAIRQRGLAQAVVGVSHRSFRFHAAIEAGVIDEGSTAPSLVLPHCDLVILATPVEQICIDLARYASLIAPNAVVTDVGSVKSRIVEVGEKHLLHNFVGGHPMAGSEKSGWEHARADLFENATWAITSTRQTSPNARQCVRDLAEAVGARVVELSPQDHDRAVAVTSHLPHLLAYALASVGGASAETDPHLFDLAAGSWASGTRVAQSSPELWRGIVMTNRDALLRALRDCQAELVQMENALEAGDDEALLQAFVRGYQAKKSGV